jgi:hypothetical protein
MVVRTLMIYIRKEDMLTKGNSTPPLPPEYLSRVTKPKNMNQIVIALYKNKSRGVHSQHPRHRMERNKA